MSERPASPAEMLALAEQQQKHAERHLAGRPGLLPGAWGLAWLLAFGELYLTVGPDPVIPVPTPIPLVLFFGILACAGVATGVHFARTTRGLRGPGPTGGAMHGWTWTLGFLCLGAMAGAMAKLGIPPEAYALLWSAGAGLLTGVLFMSGAALAADPRQYLIGGWILLVNAIGAFAGIPGHYLVMSLGCGGGLLLLALVSSMRRRRA
ncbi:hypothetical protein [Saccharopolyspora taberi]|uniref:Transporter n=1 Tax=Saccharopolyspora taberi TaxID=60895 RepID=A0ABN3V6S5_9PSEU